MWKDSLGNVYREDPGSGLKRGEKHKAKPTRNKLSKRARSQAKQAKHARYRAFVGKPNGPGKPGNKSGKNKIR